MPAQTQPPFREFVLKVHSGCQLSCDYCYMYESADPWDTPSRRMPATTVAQVCDRIGEHAERHGLADVRVVLHGGEPLLAGTAALVDAAALLRSRLGARTRAEVTVQSNGLLLDEESLTALLGAGIRVGISLDGDATANDRHRRFRDGRGSHARAARALRLLRAHPAAYAGVLAVIDLANDPVVTYESLIAFGPPRVDFLLPHGNWLTPPPGRPADDSTPYGDWLVAVFERWYAAPAQETGVRLFEEIITGLLGGASTSEAIGTSPPGVIVVDVDGALEQVDALRTTYPGAVDTAMNVFDHSFDDAAGHPDVRARRQGTAGLSPVCRRCPVVPVCGGGYHPHRYGPRGFDQPSVYCRDLFKLITHIGARLRADMAGLAGKSSSPGPAGRS